MSDQGIAIAANDMAMLTPKAMVADHFARLLITPFSRHATKWCPNRGWAINRASSAGLLRAKQNAANIINGTVGSKGRKMPIVPSATASSPADRYSWRLINIGELLW